MRPHATYHNHTTWSDGKASVTEMVHAARVIGAAEVGLSDHLVIHPDGHRYGWSIRPEQADAYLDELRAARAEAPSFVRVGLEVDWFPGHEPVLHEALSDQEVDFLIGSVHEVDGTIIDGSSRVWSSMSAAERNEVYRRYWVLIRELAESGLFDIAAHLDLPKKFGFLPTVSPETEIEAALDAILDAGLVVELNTAGWHKPIADAYPSTELLRRCHRRGIPVTLSADAHHPDHLLRDFDRGVARLRSAGYDKVARFECRRKHFVEL